MIQFRDFIILLFYYFVILLFIINKNFYIMLLSFQIEVYAEVPEWSNGLASRDAFYKETSEKNSKKASGLVPTQVRTLASALFLLAIIILNIYSLPRVARIYIVLN